MKSFSFALMLSLSIVVAIADPFEDAKKECKAKTPVQRDPFEIIEKSYEKGEEVSLSHDEECYINCVSHKMNLLDDSGAVIPNEYLKSTLKKYPQLEKYKPVLLANANIVVKATKNYKDICGKALMNSLLMVHQVRVLLEAK